MAAALENLVNTSVWLHISHDEEAGTQRATVLLADGVTLTASHAFIACALVELEAMRRGYR